MKFLLYILPLVIFTCNQPVKPNPINVEAGKILPKIYLNPDSVKVIGNNSLAINMLNAIGFWGKPSAKFVIKITEDSTNQFTLKQVDDSLYITGNSFQGVVYFLDKYCGKRFYMPGDLWTSKVKDSIFIDSGFTYTHKPFTPVIFSTGWKTGDEYVWQKYEHNVANNSYGVTQHSFSRYFYDSSALALFPDVFKNGFPKSISDQNFEPDFTNPECVAASMYVARKFFAKNPASSSISFSVMDSYNGYPKALPNETLSESFTNYINNLADSFKVVFPGKKITYIAYGSVRDLPKVKLRDNVVLITVDHISDAIKDKLFDASRLNSLSKVLSNIGNHDWAEGYGYIVPRIYSHLLQKYLLAINHAGISFQFAHLEMYPNWGLDGPKYYEMVKLYDNPYLNIDSLRTLFCKDMFGNVATQMKGYFDALEELSASQNNSVNPKINPHLADYMSQLNYSVDDYLTLSRARDYLNAALKNSTGIEHERVNVFNNGFKISEGAINLYYHYDDSTANEYLKFINDSIQDKPIYMNSYATVNTIAAQLVTQLKKKSLTK